MVNLNLHEHRARGNFQDTFIKIYQFNHLRIPGIPHLNSASSYKMSNKNPEESEDSFKISEESEDSGGKRGFGCCPFLSVKRKDENSKDSVRQAVEEKFGEQNFLVLNEMRGEIL